MNIFNIKENDYEILEKYPEVPAKLDLSYNTILEINNEYVGNKSEFTSLSQYIYQSFILKNSEYGNLYKAFEKIAIKEMQHLNILSQVLIASDTSAKFCRKIDDNEFLCNYWSTQNVNFENDIIKFLKSDIILEEKAIASYKNIIKIGDNNSLNEIIERILEDEYKHLEFFNKLLYIFNNKENMTKNSEDDS